MSSISISDMFAPGSYMDCLRQSLPVEGRQLFSKIALSRSTGAPLELLQAEYSIYEAVIGLLRAGGDTTPSCGTSAANNEFYALDASASRIASDWATPDIVAVNALPQAIGLQQQQSHAPAPSSPELRRSRPRSGAVSMHEDRPIPLVADASFYGEQSDALRSDTAYDYFGFGVSGLPETLSGLASESGHPDGNSATLNYAGYVSGFFGDYGEGFDATYLGPVQEVQNAGARCTNTTHYVHDNRDLNGSAPAIDWQATMPDLTYSATPYGSDGSMSVATPSSIQPSPPIKLPSLPNIIAPPAQGQTFSVDFSFGLNPYAQAQSPSYPKGVVWPSSSAYTSAASGSVKRKCEDGDDERSVRPRIG